MKVPGSKIVPCQGVLGSNHSLTFGLFTQVSGSGPLGPLVILFLNNGTFLNLFQQHNVAVVDGLVVIFLIT